MGYKLCVFSTCNDKYIPKSAVSLLSFHKFNTDFDMFIICTECSDENKKMCNRLGIQIIKCDLSSYFYKEKNYPKECFYHFKAPDIFHNMSYDYAVNRRPCGTPFAMYSAETRSVRFV